MMTADHTTKSSSNKADTMATTSQSNSDHKLDDHEHQCGCGSCQPKCLQKLARPVVFLICICALFLAQSSLMGGYISSIITNLEKRYDLSTSQIGYILSSFDIMAVFTVFLVSYFGDQFNRAHVLGYGALAMSVGAGIFSLPQWFGKDYQKYESYEQTQGPGVNGSLNSVFSDVNLCNFTEDASPLDSTLACQDFSPQLWALAVFITAMLVLSIGSAPVYILGPTYLYDNVPAKSYSLYAGILYSMVALGPASGFLIGAAFISVYVDPWDKPPGAAESDSEWVGAWWMGLLLCSGLLLIAAIPLMMFPRHLPRIEWKEDSKGHGEDDESQPIKPGFGNNIKEMPRKTCALLCNPLFVFATLTLVMEQIVTSGFIAYIAKYFQVAFDMAASRANIITGAVIIPGAVAGMITGGAIMRRLQLPLVSIAKFLLMLGFIPILLVGVLLFLGCKNIDLAGITTQYGFFGIAGAGDRSSGPPDLLDEYSIHYKENLTDPCNMNCRCSSAVYLPVCGGDDITYFSPCHAGCTELKQYHNEDGKLVRNYTSCGCVYEDFVYQSVPGVVTAGKCDMSCKNIYPAIVLLFFIVFVTCCGQNPILLITLRCVDSDQRSFAMGIQNIIVRLLAQIPAPIYFGMVFDKECILWSETCDGKGACLEYNIERLPFVFFGVSLAIKCLSYICIAGMYISARCMDISRKKKEKTMAVNGVNGVVGHENGGFDSKTEISDVDSISNATDATEVTVSTISNTTQSTYL